VNPAGLTASPTPVNVQVSATGASNSPQTIVVNFTLRQPVLSVSAGNVDFTVNAGGTATQPAEATITVTNTGEGTLASLGTITCTPPVGSPVTCAVTQNTGELTITVNPATIIGTKVFPVVVSAPNSNVARTVTVTVTSATNIGLSPKELNFQAIRGSTTLIVKKVKVSNTGDGSLGTITCQTNPAPWLTCTIGATPDELVLTANPTGVNTSPVDVEVEVRATNAFNNPQKLTVSLTIQQPILSLDQTLVNRNVNAAGPAVQVTVTASNAGAGNLANLGTISCNPGDAHLTCTVNQNTGVITFTITPTVAPAFLAGQTHVLTATISAANMGNGQSPVVAIVVTVQ
jgi:hypothetical protein